MNTTLNREYQPRHTNKLGLASPQVSGIRQEYA